MGYELGTETGIVRGAVGIIARDGCWLVIQRAQHIVAGGAWCFPGGTLEDGETFAEAVVREISEELSLVVTPSACVWQWSRDDGRLHLEWWTTTLAGDAAPVPDPSEVADFQWLPPSEIRELPGLLPNNIEFLDHAERINFWPDGEGCPPDLRAN